MSTTTANLGLFKYDTSTDANVAFSIDNALNANWDILDTAVGTGGSPTTVVSGDTWYRQWTDGWKEQGGLVEIQQTERDWESPLMASSSDNGTLGGDTFACTLSSSGMTTAIPWMLFNGNTSNAAWHGQTGSGTLDFYNPLPLKLISFQVYGNGDGNWVTSGMTLSASHDGTNYTTLATYSTTFDSVTWALNLQTPYKYFRINCTFANYGCIWKEVKILAKEIINTAQTVTFPQAFNNTNYSYTLAFQDGSGEGAYVSNKLTTGMVLNNQKYSLASWTACGY